MSSSSGEFDSKDLTYSVSLGELEQKVKNKAFWIKKLHMAQFRDVDKSTNIKMSKFCEGSEVTLILEAGRKGPELEETPRWQGRCCHGNSRGLQIGKVFQSRVKISKVKSFRARTFSSDKTSDKWPQLRLGTLTEGISICLIDERVNN